MKPKIRMVSDTTLLIAVVICSLVYTAAVLLTMFVLINEDTVSKSSEVPAIRLLFGVLLVSWWVAIVALMPRYLAVITISKEMISVWIPFSGQKTYDYKQFRHVYCGGYFHGNIAGVGRNVWYIIISKKYLSQKELDQINQVSNSLETVKIRYSPKRYRVLRSILPASLAIQLENAVEKVGRIHNNIGIS